MAFALNIWNQVTAVTCPLLDRKNKYNWHLSVLLSYFWFNKTWNAVTLGTRTRGTLVRTCTLGWKFGSDCPTRENSNTWWMTYGFGKYPHKILLVEFTQLCSINDFRFSLGTHIYRSGLVKVMPLKKCNVDLDSI